VIQRDPGDEIDLVAAKHLDTGLVAALPGG
jgi:hypothetical protein